MSTGTQTLLSGAAANGWSPRTSWRARFDHVAARPASGADDGYGSDPHLHPHVVIANMTRPPDGQWRVLDPVEIYRSQASAVYRLCVRICNAHPSMARANPPPSGACRGRSRRARKRQWSARRSGRVRTADGSGPLPESSELPGVPLPCEVRGPDRETLRCSQHPRPHGYDFSLRRGAFR